MRSLILFAASMLGCGQATPAPDTATVTLGTPQVTQPLPLSASIDLQGVQSVLEEDLDQLTSCYRERLFEDPSLSGEVLIHWAISTEGAHTHGCITEDTVEDSGVSDCVNAFITRSDYPAAQGQDVDVSFPFRFQPAS